MMMPSEPSLEARFAALDLSVDGTGDKPPGKALPKPKMLDKPLGHNWYPLSNTSWSVDALEVNDNVEVMSRPNPNNNPWCRASQDVVKRWERQARHWLAMLSYGSYFQRAQEDLITKTGTAIRNWARMDPTAERTGGIFH